MPRTSKTLFLYPIEADGSKLHVVLVTQHKQISGPAVASGIMMSSKKKNEASDDKMTFAFFGSEHWIDFDQTLHRLHRLQWWFRLVLL